MKWVFCYIGIFINYFFEFNIMLIFCKVSIEVNLLYNVYVVNVVEEFCFVVVIDKFGNFSFFEVSYEVVVFVF